MNEIVVRVRKKERMGARPMQSMVITFAILFLILTVTVSRGFFVLFLLCGVGWFLTSSFSRKEYEYRYRDPYLEIITIKGGGRQVLSHSLYLGDLIVVAPHAHEAVLQYRQNGGGVTQKFDYTSYDDDIPYYTMIIDEEVKGKDGEPGEKKKRKFLLDLPPDMLREMKRRYPDKVYL